MTEKTQSVHPIILTSAAFQAVGHRLLLAVLGHEYDYSAFTRHLRHQQLD